MKVCLVNPPDHFFPHFTPIPPLSILCVGTVLKNSGVDVEILDFNDDKYRVKNVSDIDKQFEQILQTIRSKKPDVLGFTSFYTNFPIGLLLAKRYKEMDGKCIIVFGGEQVSFLDYSVMREYEFIDVIVRFEAEETILDFIDTLRNGGSLKNVKGITFREDKSIHRNEEREPIYSLDALPMPDYFMSNISSKKVSGKFFFRIEGGRGCIFKCKFCASTNFWKNSIRSESLEKIMGSIRYLSRDNSPMHLSIVHDLFTFNKKRVEDFCDRLIQERYIDLTWDCFAHINLVDEEMLKKLKQARCEGLFFGLEVGDERIKRNAGKKFTQEKAKNIITLTIDQGIPCLTSFIINLPGEKKDELNKTLFLVSHFRAMGAELKMSTFRPMPGSDFFYKEDPNNWFLVTRDEIDSLAHSNIWTQARRMIKTNPYLFSGFYGINNPDIGNKTIQEIEKYYNILTYNYPLCVLLLLHSMNNDSIGLWKKFKGFLGKHNLHFSGIIENFPQFLSMELCPAIKKDRMNEIYRFESSYASFLSRRKSTDYNRNLNFLHKRPLKDFYFRVNTSLETKEFKYDIFLIRSLILSGDIESINTLPKKETNLLFYCRGFRDSRIKKITKNEYQILKLLDPEKNIKSNLAAITAQKLFSHKKINQIFREWIDEDLLILEPPAKNQKLKAKNFRRRLDGN